MRRRIYLMRHGAVVYFQPDGTPIDADNVPLSAEGRRQADHAGEALAGVRFDRVITSHLPRTRETAQRVMALQPADHPQPAPEAVPELRELHGGDIEQIDDEDLYAAFTVAFRGVVPEHTAFLGGETIGALMDRILPAFGRVLDDPDWDTLLMVLHGGVNRGLISRVLTGQRMYLGSFEQAPGCINVLDMAADSSRHSIVRCINTSAIDLAHTQTRETTMELLFGQYLQSRG